MRVGWLEALIRRGIEDGIYAAEVVDPHAIAKPLISIYIGLRWGRLMREDVDIIGAVRDVLHDARRPSAAEH